MRKKIEVPKNIKELPAKDPLKYLELIYTDIFQTRETVRNIEEQNVKLIQLISQLIAINKQYQEFEEKFFKKQQAS